ncbi:H-2 class I histocompatibility antigen, K-D alpha chain-like [Clarias gariepinus]|uniref:H-2 class I histocompatibility antigen, K-D alpha chain-like n=1 Tax=Clarias gariepinus TaxID=13013 RepID=UPI00234DD444|nr:H-2 class I histocompatibility antigen, K-D alpha chain-like [Clarias gariepinus]
MALHLTQSLSLPMPFSALRPILYTHSLQYLYTANTGVTAALLDRKQFAYFGNNITVILLKLDCMKNVEADDREYWRRETERVRNDQHWLQEKEQSFNQTKGVNVLNRKYGCELDSNGTTRGYDQYTCDEEDFISLNLTTETWTAANDKAKCFIKEWNSDGERAKHGKDFLKKDCIDQLKKIVSCSNTTQDRKGMPMFQKHSSPSPGVMCHAISFFFKPVTITWKKDGEDVHGDVHEDGETIPNQDGSFQKSILKVPPEELQEHTYTCVVQHSSLEKEIILKVPKGPYKLEMQRVKADFFLQ